MCVLCVCIVLCSCNMCRFTWLLPQSKCRTVHNHKDPSSHPFWSHIPLSPYYFQSLATTTLFFSFVILSFQEWYTNCIRLPVVFWGSLFFPPLSIKPWRAIHDFECINSSLLFIAKQYVEMYCITVFFKPFAYWKKSKLFSYFGYYGYSCYEHWYTDFSMGKGFHFFGISVHQYNCWLMCQVYVVL